MSTSTGSFTFFNSFREYALDGTIDLDTDTFKVLLTTSAQALSASGQAVLADLTGQVANGNGYTTGGVTLASVTWNRSGGTVTFDSADPSWTASGGSIVARYWVLYKSGTANAIVSPLVAFGYLDATPADVTATDGSALTYTVPATGWFTLT